MTDSRPGNKTPSVKFSVESDFQIKILDFCVQKGEIRKNKFRKFRKKNCNIRFLVFFNPFMGLYSSPNWQLLDSAKTCPGNFRDNSEKFPGHFRGTSAGITIIAD